LRFFLCWVQPPCPCLRHTGTNSITDAAQILAAAVSVLPANTVSFNRQTSISKNIELKKMYYYKISFSYISLHAKKPVGNDRAHLAHNLTTKSSLDKIKAAGNAAFIF